MKKKIYETPTADVVAIASASPLLAGSISINDSGSAVDAGDAAAPGLADPIEELLGGAGLPTGLPF